MTRHAAAAAALASLLVATHSSAIGFDALGESSLSPAAAWTLSFEPGEVPEPDAGALSVEQSDSALHGLWLLRIEQYQGVNVPVTPPPGSKRHRVSVWARGDVLATIELGYTHERVDQLGVLYPTGRMTSDGWYELETRDFSIDAEIAKRVQIGLFSPSGAEIDAIELVPEGPAAPLTTCAGISDKSACGAGELCMWGVCRNVASRVPALPPPAWRGELVDYLSARLEYLYGPFKNRAADLPAARLELEAMRGATDAWSFWRRFRTAIHRLHDWHTTTSDLSAYVIDNPKPIGVCFIEGIADLSEQIAPSHAFHRAVLVSHVGSVNSFGLVPGDRLIAVDGKHPIDWARSLLGVDAGFWTASNPRTHAEDVSRLNRLIGQFATQISVLRCSPATAVCGPEPETISISDLQPSPPGTTSGIGCDNRPVLHVPGTPESHPQSGVFQGLVKESSPEEAIYGLSWSSLSVGGSGNVGLLLEQAVAEWRSKARGVILDHRTGYGGTNLGPPIIWNFVRTPTPLDVFEFRQHSRQQAPATLADGKQIFEAFAALGAVQKAGGPNPALDVPVALLVHLDGSASDWLALGVKGAPKAKLFGPYETAGAFSTLFSFGYWAGVGYSIAVGDTYHVSGETLNGQGVVPDVLVDHKQSDLLAGRDTIYDVALDWVRQELKP
jgi:hypothetical protein